MSESADKFVMLDAYRIADRERAEPISRHVVSQSEDSFYDFHVNLHLDFQEEFTDDARADINCCLESPPLVTSPVAISAFDDVYWRDNLSRCSYFLPYLDYTQDYLPAYQLGYEARLGQPIHSRFEQFEHEIEVQWETFRQHSRLDWDQARAAARDAWYRVTEFST